MKKGLLIALGSALATAAVIKAAPALAEPAQSVAMVHTADLDLSSTAGRAELDRRLVRAAYDVCGSASDADLAGKIAVRHCRVDVLAKARTQTQRLASKAGGTIEIVAVR
jgi:UrcA family protein